MYGQIIHRSMFTKDIIIDDLRYQNELEACLKNDFVIIELTLPFEVQMESVLKVYPIIIKIIIIICHISEKGGLK